MAYADYDFYTISYKGTAIPSAVPFERAEVKAEAFINQITYGRITEATDDVKKAVCAVCDVIFTYEGREGISSENNDGYSVNYEKTNVRLKMLDAAKLFLPAQLLYRGL